MNRLSIGLLAGSVLVLAGCAITTPSAQVEPPAPPQWYAPLPHAGNVTDLTQWWQQQGDPLLVELIAAAEAVNPTVASAAARIEQARAARIGAGAALLPSLDGSASATRSNTQVGTPLGTVVQAGLQTAWEIDLFGNRRFGVQRTQAQLDGAQAGWHDARVSIAAETATQYLSLRSCQQLLEVNRADAQSRAETARLAQLSANAGFTAPATAALARASAAEANGRLVQQATSCDLSIKALVALSAIAEPTLRGRLATTVRPAIVPITVESLPAALLRQRPDVRNAEYAVAAASAAVGSSIAQQYPRLTLNGSIGAGSFLRGGDSTTATTWSIGPLSLSLPLFDGGSRRANADAARASYDEAVLLYRAKVRQAVREVEEALVNLDSTARRGDDAEQAVAGYRASFNGTESRYQTGLANLVELEDARRLRLAAELALINLQQQRSAAWIALYRAAGGGWQAPSHS